MEAAFKRYLTEFYKSLMYNQVMSFLERYFTNELKFEDEKKQRYRSSKDLEKLKTNAKDECEAASKELVDELEVAGIVSTQDFIDKQTDVEEILEKYLNKLKKYLRGL